MMRVYWALIVVFAAGLLFSAIPWFGIYTTPLKYPNVFFGDVHSVLTGVGQLFFILLPIFALIGALRSRFYFFTCALLHTFVASYFNVPVLYGVTRVPFDLGPLNAHPIWVVNGLVAVGILVMLTLGRGVGR